MSLQGGRNSQCPACAFEGLILTCRIEGSRPSNGVQLQGDKEVHFSRGRVPAIYKKIEGYNIAYRILLGRMIMTRACASPHVERSHSSPGPAANVGRRFAPLVQGMCCSHIFGAHPGMPHFWYTELPAFVIG